MTDSPTPWPTLREFLDAGGDLEVGWPGKARGILIEHLYDAPLPPIAHDRAIKVAILWSEETLEQAQERTTCHLVDERHFADRRSEAWAAEILADSDLLARVIALLTPEERAKGEHNRDEEMRTHPLRVGNPADQPWWRCQNCGAAHDDGDGVEAVIIGSREGYSDLAYEITYCRDCIAMALAALDAGRVSS